MSKEYKTIPAGEVLGRFSSTRRARIDMRAAQLIAEEVGLSELRKSKKVTQEQLAKKFGGRQVYVSRFEKRSDVRLSKLRQYVEALGGNLELVVTFPDKSAFTLGGFRRMKDAPRRRAPASAKASKRRLPPQ